MLADAQATSALLGTIAAGLITVTSITISLLLLAVQQAAASMTSEVVDQFLRSRYNQVYFGFFIGLALYALITLATVSEPFNPVFGTLLAFLLTVVALSLLLLLLYTTVNQMRPIEIIDNIRDYTVAARVHQLSMVRRTRPASSLTGVVTRPLRACRSGYVTGIDLDALGSATRAARHETEVVLSVSIGSHVAFQHPLGVVHAETDADADAMAEAVEAALRLERRRDPPTDPAYGIEQLETIAWTSVSTSKSNPAPGLLVIQTLHEILAQWSIEDGDRPAGKMVPVVYADNALPRVLTTLETLAVVSTESMQHQVFTEVVRLVTVMFNRLPAQHQPRVEDLVLRILSGLGDHVLTADLDAALSALAGMFAAAGRHETAHAVDGARARLTRSVGRLHSRSTRATAE